MELLQPSSLDELGLTGDRLALAGGTELVPLLRAEAPELAGQA